MSLMATASQTVGPYVSIGFAQMEVSDLTVSGQGGVSVTICGRILDGDGKPVNDGVVEIWQADQFGRYAHPEDNQTGPRQPGFRGFGRVLTDDNGAFRFSTVKPGPVAGPGGAAQAPHLVAVVFMRGMLKHLVTRIYFPGEAANADDPVLKLVPPERRETLVALKRPDESLEWNIILQGDKETVFFDC